MEVRLLPPRSLRANDVYAFSAYALLLSMLAYPAIARCQSTDAAPTDASAILSQISNVFSAGKAVSQLQLSGSATWYSGGSEDSGAATLTATASGSAQMQLSLAEKGLWTESQGDIGPDMDCQWAGADGVAHSGDAMNCLRPVVWFVPMISLQRSLIPSTFGMTDLGIARVGSRPDSYRHLQGQFVFSNMPMSLTKDLMQRSTIDIGLDPTSYLPAVLTYTVQPDSGSLTPIVIEIRYFNYTTVNGVQVPFEIQRYLNGSLQLDIVVKQAQVN